MDDDAIRTVVTRLARPHPSGGGVVERAAILAEGIDSSAILDWIADHDGKPEDAAPVASGNGLHSDRADNRANARPPQRYVLPREALS
jgi:hypothetical protein